MHVGEPVALVWRHPRACPGRSRGCEHRLTRKPPRSSDAREAAAPAQPQNYAGRRRQSCRSTGQSRRRRPIGRTRGVARIVASAAHVARVSELNQRIGGRHHGAARRTATHDPTTDSYTMRCAPERDLVARRAGRRDGNRARQAARRDRGWAAAFGMKSPVYPEYPALLVAPGCSAAASTSDGANRANPSSPTTRPATCSPTASWRSTTRASSWPCRLFLGGQSRRLCGASWSAPRHQQLRPLLSAMYRIPAIDVRVR